MLLPLALAVVALSTAVGATGPALSTYKQTKCLTSSCATNPHAPPHTVHHHETVTVPVIEKKKITPCTTIHPPAVTDTQTAYTVVTTTTTLAQKTDTFSTTSTDYTIIVTDTTTTVTTTSTATTTATVGPYFSATPGFVPVFSGIADVGGTPSKRKRDADRQRGPAPAPVQERAASLKTKKLGTHVSPARHYPKQVLCNTITKIYSRTTKTITYPTKTVTAKPDCTTTTTTSTFTITETSIPGDASITLSFSTTISLTGTLTRTSTSTVPTTTTTTSTNLAAAPTYEACQANNIGRYFSPGQGFDYGTSNRGFLDVPTAASPEDCCKLCVAAGTACGGSVWIPNNECYLFEAGSSCEPTDLIGTMFYRTAQFDQIVSNGNCGQFGFVRE